MVSVEAVQRIIDEVGVRYIPEVILTADELAFLARFGDASQAPATIARQRLELALDADLENLAAAYRLRTRHYRMAPKKDLERHLVNVQAAADRLHALFFQEDGARYRRWLIELLATAACLQAHQSRAGAGLPDNWTEAVERVIAGLPALKTWVDHAHERHLRDCAFLWRDWVARDADQTGGWLFSRRLPAIYRRRYRREPACSRGSDGKPSGPFIRFAITAAEAIAATKPNGKCYGAETAAKYLQDWRGRAQARIARRLERRRAWAARLSRARSP